MLCCNMQVLSKIYLQIKESISGSKKARHLYFFTHVLNSSDWAALAGEMVKMQEGLGRPDPPPPNLQTVWAISIICPKVRPYWQWHIVEFYQNDFQTYHDFIYNMDTGLQTFWRRTELAVWDGKCLWKWSLYIRESQLYLTSSCSH